MKKIFLTTFFILFALTGCNNMQQENKTEPNLASLNLKYEENTVTTPSTSPEISKVSVTTEVPKKEETISEFSTKIYDKDKDRQSNLELTCSKVNEHIVKSGETFSFCDTVGKATPEAGYEKAKIFDSDGDVHEGYGGGNCQVSTTIFNAVRNLPGIEVTERHDHSNKVPYAKQGDDAAVAYGGYDFKFINHNDYDIIMHLGTDGNNVTATINKIS